MAYLDAGSQGYMKIGMHVIPDYLSKYEAPDQTFLFIAVT